MLLALTATDKATITLAAVTAFLALIALAQLIAFNRSEGRRTQPVVILNKGQGRDLLSGFGVFLTNEGAGTGFKRPGSSAGRETPPQTAGKAWGDEVPERTNPGAAPESPNLRNVAALVRSEGSGERAGANCHGIASCR